MNRILAATLILLGGLSSACSAQMAAQKARMDGVYKLIDDASQLPKGMQNTGGPNELPLTEKALQIQHSTSKSDDSAKLCLPVGPFRMMAWPGNVIDLYQSSDRVTVLFQDLYFGHMRTIYTEKQQHDNGPALWEGDSIGHWDQNTFVVDTTNFNSYVWLNDAGAPHSPALHLTERYEFLRDGRLLKVSVTADDPEMLKHPYTYVRYYEKSAAEVQERVCWEDTKPVGR